MLYSKRFKMLLEDKLGQGETGGLEKVYNGQAGLVSRGGCFG